MSRAEFISDERKLNLQPNDIFDRIINLKIHCAEKDKNGNIVADSQEAFVIRSDYELVYPDTSFDTDRKAERGRFIIRRCTQKPSIKVQCKMVTSNVGTSIGITVSNFFMLSADGKHLKSFNASKYVITAVEIVMGYWGQLKDSIDFTKSDEELLQNYFTLLPINGADKISMTGVGCTSSLLVMTRIILIFGRLNFRNRFSKSTFRKRYQALCKRTQTS